MSKTLVLGTGNLLLMDDGFGIHAIRRLQEKVQLPEGVELIDGGTLGLDLIYYLEEEARLLIIDTMETGGPPGTLKRLSGDEVPAYLEMKMSPHEIGIPDMLFSAKLKNLYPKEVVIWGVQPAEIRVGLELSPPLQAQLDPMVEHVMDELTRWGNQLTSIA
jgi:hydrogenase maturation protease